MSFELKIKNLQTALFVKNFDFSQKLKIAQDINNKVGNFFNGNPMILPLPDDYPPDAPRIILKDSDSLFSCNVSLSRVDLFYKSKGTPEKQFKDIEKDYFRILWLLVDFLNKDSNAIIHRVGFVPTFFAALDQSANAFLRTTFIKGPYFEDPFELGINVLHKVHLSAWDVNRWFRIYGLHNVDNPEDDRGLEILIDINTLEEKVHNLNLDSVQKFIEESLLSIREVLEKHLKVGF